MNKIMLYFNNLTNRIAQCRTSKGRTMYILSFKNNELSLFNPLIRNQLPLDPTVEASKAGGGFSPAGGNFSASFKNSHATPPLEVFGLTHTGVFYHFNNFQKKIRVWGRVRVLGVRVAGYA